MSRLKKYSRTTPLATVLCPGKTASEVVARIRLLLKHHSIVVALKATDEVYKQVKPVIPDARYHSVPKMITVQKDAKKISKPGIMIVTGGRSDTQIAEEAAITAELLGHAVIRRYDVGVAQIDDLLQYVDELKKANVIVAVAGMEGALATVVSGLVNAPVVAVPTSQGSGVQLSGITTLLSMMTSCAPGVAVVNIDNGFGAGYIAAMINNLSTRHDQDRK